MYEYIDKKDNRKRKRARSGSGVPEGVPVLNFIFV